MNSIEPKYFVTLAICSFLMVSALTFVIYKVPTPLVKNLTELDARNYNACLAGCLNSVIVSVGNASNLDRQNKTQEFLFVSCGNLCVESYNQNFTEVSNE